MGTFRLPVNLEWNGPGSPGVNVWHFRTVNELPPFGTPQVVADALRAFYQQLAATDWGGGGAGIFPATMRINASEAVEVSTQESAPVDWTEVYVDNGVNDAPPIAQICISWRTSVAARRARGRTFLGPLGAHVVAADGTPFPGVLSLVSDAAQALVTASSGVNDWAVGVYGLQNPAPQGTTDWSNLPRVLRDFTGFRITDQFAVLRSRRD